MFGNHDLYQAQAGQYEIFAGYHVEEYVDTRWYVEVIDGELEEVEDIESSEESLRADFNDMVRKYENIASDEAEADDEQEENDDE